ncbi:MAG: Bax inhibitor-1/YccA family protein [Planctomycetaceae bacterium]|nr:Bax inhibitor-1/YccA family protein [Planctomycetaceae bacterium]
MDPQRTYDFEDNFVIPNQFVIVTFMNRVYAWMTLGLAATGVTAWLVAANAPEVAFQPGVMFGLIIATLGLVIGLSMVAQRLPAPLAIGGFLLYAILNGVLFSVIFARYPVATIYLVFFITAGLFGSMALFGTITKKDLTGVGALCMMGLWGVILAMIVQWIAGAFFGMPMREFDFLISIVGVVVFIGLTAYDAQKIKQLSVAGETSTGLAILGALALYLDFINLFLFLLRIFGRGRD